MDLCAGSGQAMCAGAAHDPAADYENIWICHGKALLLVRNIERWIYQDFAVRLDCERITFVNHGKIID